MNCVFCKIIKGEVPSYKVYEDEHSLAFLDIYPVTEGHTLVIPKKHFENIFDISSEELHKTMDNVQKVAELVKRKFNADGVNVLHASGEAAGQTVFHLHFHIIPRMRNDGIQAWPHHRPNKFDLEGIHKKLVETEKT